jgi:hypothetical protein
VQHFLLNHSELIERKTDISIKQITEQIEIQKCIDLFNSEIQWNDMFNVEQALDRIERGEKMFVGYKNEDIFCYCWIKENHKDDYYIYNVFSKKPKSLRKIGVIDLLYLVIKNYTTGKIRAEIDDWNTQSQRVFERLGFNLIYNSLITNNL